MKKVLFIVPSLMQGGMEKMLVTIANIISSYAEVVIYNLGSDDAAMTGALNEGIEYHSLWNPCIFVLKKSYFREEKGNKRILPAKLWYKFHSPKYIQKRIVKDSFDVQIAFFVGEPTKIVGGCDKSVKSLLWIHSDYTKARGLFDTFKSKSEANETFSHYSRIICVSKMAESAFQSITHINNTQVIYNYLPVQKIQQLAALEHVDYQNKFTLVSVGRLVAAKGYDRLLRVINSLNRSGYELQLKIIGDGAEFDNLETEIKYLGLKNVELLGKKSNPYPYVAHADLFVCSSYYEGYNLAVAEAIILGVPVISTRCAGPVEILDNGEYGMLVENSEEGLLDGIRQLLDSDATLICCKEKALVRREFFNEDRIKSQLIDIILK